MDTAAKSDATMEEDLWKRENMKPNKTFILFLILFLAFSAHSRLETELIEKETIQIFTREISGIRAKEFVAEISQYHRINGAYENTGYEKAVDYVMSILKAAGAEDVELLTFISDGEKTHGTWRSKPGFRVRSAKLSMTQPFQKTWCDFNETPVSLMSYSNGDGTYEAEVIYVGRGTSDKHYANRDVKGKIVLADRWDVTTQALVEEAVKKRGALGILMAFSGNARRGKYPTLVELNNLHTPGKDDKSSRWGFSLSKLQTDLLKRLLRLNQKVVMRAEIDAETFSGHMPIITTAIKGTKYPEQEVVYMAHLDHYKPGANDNASGAAGLMEMVVTLTKLIKENTIARPLRTIRFLWVPEWEGTAAYVANNRETAKRGIAGINLDMIGEDLKKCQTKLFILRTPLSRPTFLDALFAHYVGYIKQQNITSEGGTKSKFDYEIIGYLCESDHMMYNDASIGVPVAMMCHLADVFWHTSFDTLDKVDPTELKRSILLGLFTGWTVANYDRVHIQDIMEMTHQDILKQIDGYSSKYKKLLKDSDKTYLHQHYRNINNYYNLLYDYSIKSLDSVFENSTEVKPELSSSNDCKKQLKIYIEKQKQIIADLYTELCEDKGIEPAKAELSSLEKECAGIIPKKLIDLALSGWKIIEIRWEKGINKHMNNDMVHEMLNFADGRRNLLEIRDAVSAEYREVDIEHVKTLFDALKEREIVVFKYSGINSHA